MKRSTLWKRLQWLLPRLNSKWTNCPRQPETVPEKEREPASSARSLCRLRFEKSLPKLWGKAIREWDLIFLSNTRKWLLKPVSLQWANCTNRRSNTRNWGLRVTAHTFHSQFRLQVILAQAKRGLTLESQRNQAFLSFLWLEGRRWIRREIRARSAPLQSTWRNQTNLTFRR